MHCKYKPHIMAYGCVSFLLIVLGSVISMFAILQLDPAISQAWLAGPTTMAVGFVLCGKVIIDCHSLSDRVIKAVPCPAIEVYAMFLIRPCTI